MGLGMGWMLCHLALATRHRLILLCHPGSGGRAVSTTWPPASPGSLDENVVALLGSAGHLCCQDRTLGQASCWSCQQLGINQSSGGLSVESLTRNRCDYPSAHMQTGEGTQRVVLSVPRVPREPLQHPSAASVPIHALSPSSLGAKTLPHPSGLFSSYKVGCGVPP